MPYLIKKERHGVEAVQWDLQGKRLIVGRGEEAQARVEDCEISGRHFAITPGRDGYVLTDLQSRNGTFVNGKKVAQVTLVPNDRIMAGRTCFEFVDGLNTVIGKVAQEGMGLGTCVRDLSADPRVK